MGYLRIDERNPEHIAIVEDSGKSYTYGDLVTFCTFIAKCIDSRELVFVLTRNCFSALAAHCACVENQIVHLMLSANMDRQLLTKLIEIYEPAYLWLPNDVALSLSYEIVAEHDAYNLMKTGFRSPIMHEDLAMLLTTSGSTGSPKLVRHAYKNLYENARNVSAVFGFSETDHAWIDLQLHYTMGLNVACSNLYAGATLYMTSLNMMDKHYWDFYENSSITNMTGVPYNYEMLKKLKFFRKDHPNLRIMAEGGGRLTDETFRLVAEYADGKGIRFFATFGTSETTARLAYLDPALAKDKTGSIGRAIPGGRLDLRDEAGNILNEAEAEGELIYSGPNVTMGYALKKDDLSLGDIFCGKYCTGDLARRDTDGCYYIVGRKSRFLKMYSHRVSLDETERLIGSRFGISCACAGTDQQMLIYVEQDVCEAEIQKYLSELMQIPTKSFAIKYVAEIPRNEVGKVLYKNL